MAIVLENDLELSALNSDGNATVLPEHGFTTVSLYGGDLQVNELGLSFAAPGS